LAQRKNRIMDFELKALGLLSVGDEKCDALVVLVPQSFKPAKDDLSLLVGQAIKSGDLQTKAGKCLVLYRPLQADATRVVLAGVGEGSGREIRTAVAVAWGAVKSPNIKKVVLSFSQPAQEEAVRAAVLALADATYVYTSTKSKPVGRTVKKAVIATTNAAEVQRTFHRSVATVSGVELAKEWANRPANHATPALLADAAHDLAKSPKIRCEVLGPKDVAKLGMGSFMAVAQGSEQPLRFIVLHYDGAVKTCAPTVLVGKGITFDSGGISIKPAPEMDEMKFDMSGAASVLGVFRALALLKPLINVVGLIPACENLLSGRSVKPGDVVRSLSGQTIEILNTDAEGRLVLCDALTYAERFKPAAVIDIATLTGACMIALGGVRSGLFASKEDLANALQDAGEESQDLCWKMPLDEDYAEGLKTNFADIANVGGRAGGAVTAAKFLQRFAAKYPWAHLDIAGTAWKSGVNKGATGRPVGLIVEYLLTTADNK
jgi:leucyl aminopeptidase